MPEKETEEQKIFEDEERMCQEETENVVKKNNENKEERQSTVTLNGEKEAVLGVETKHREGGTGVRGETERGTGTEGNPGEIGSNGGKTVELGGADIVEGIEGRALVEEKGEGTAEADPVEGRAAVVEVKAEKEVALAKSKEGQSRSSDGQDRGATEHDEGGAKEQQEMAANGKGQMEERVECVSAGHLSEVTELTTEAISSNTSTELSSTAEALPCTD